MLGSEVLFRNGDLTIPPHADKQGATSWVRKALHAEGGGVTENKAKVQKSHLSMGFTYYSLIAHINSNSIIGSGTTVLCVCCLKHSDRQKSNWVSPLKDQ